MSRAVNDGPGDLAKHYRHKRPQSDEDESQLQKAKTTATAAGQLLPGGNSSNATPSVVPWQQLKLQLATERQRQQVQSERKALERELGSAGGPDDLTGHAWYHGGAERGMDRAEAERLLMQCVAEEHNNSEDHERQPSDADADSDMDSDSDDEQRDGQRYFYCFLVRDSGNVRPPGRYVLSCARVDNKEGGKKRRRRRRRRPGLVLHFVINEIRQQPGTVYERAQYSFGDTAATGLLQTPGFDTVPGLIRYYVGGSGDSAVLSYGDGCSSDDSVPVQAKRPTEVRIRYPCNRRRPLSARSNPGVSATPVQQVPIARAGTLPRATASASATVTSASGGTLGRPIAAGPTLSRPIFNQLPAPFSASDDNNEDDDGQSPVLDSHVDHQHQRIRQPSHIRPRRRIDANNNRQRPPRLPDSPSPPLSQASSPHSVEYESPREVDGKQRSLSPSPYRQWEKEGEQQQQQQKYINLDNIDNLKNKKNHKDAINEGASSSSRAISTSVVPTPSYQERYAADLERFVHEEQRRHLMNKYDQNDENKKANPLLINSTTYSNVDNRNTIPATRGDMNTRGIHPSNYYANNSAAAVGGYTPSIHGIVPLDGVNASLPPTNNVKPLSNDVVDTTATITQQHATRYTPSNLIMIPLEDGADTNSSSTDANTRNNFSGAESLNNSDETETFVRRYFTATNAFDLRSSFACRSVSSNNADVPFTRSASFRSSTSSGSCRSLPRTSSGSFRCSSSSSSGSSLPRANSVSFPRSVGTGNHSTPPPQQQATARANGVRIAYRYKLATTLGEAGTVTLDDNRMRPVASAADMETRARQEQLAERVLPRLLRGTANAINARLGDNNTVTEAVPVQPGGSIGFEDTRDPSRQPPWERQRAPIAARRPLPSACPSGRVLSSFDPPDRFHSLLLPGQQQPQQQHSIQSTSPPRQQRTPPDVPNTRELVQRWLLEDLRRGPNNDHRRRRRRRRSWSSDDDDDAYRRREQPGSSRHRLVHDRKNDTENGANDLTDDGGGGHQQDPDELRRCSEGENGAAKTRGERRRPQSGVAAALRAVHLAVIDDDGVADTAGGAVSSSAVAGSRRLAATLCRWDSRVTVLPYLRRRRRTNGDDSKPETATADNPPIVRQMTLPDPHSCPLQMLGSPSHQGRRARLDVIERFACIQYLVSLTIIVTPCLLLIGDGSEDTKDTDDDFGDHDLQVEYSRRRRKFYYRCAGGADHSDDDDSGSDSDSSTGSCRSAVRASDYKKQQTLQLDKRNQKNNQQQLEEVDWSAERRFWRCELASKRAAALDKWIRTAADARQAAGDMYAWSALMSALCSPRVQALDDAWSALRRTRTHSAFAFESRLRPEYLREQNLSTANRAQHRRGNSENDDEPDDYQLPPNATIPDPMAVALLYEHLYNYNGFSGRGYDDDEYTREDDTNNSFSWFTSPLLDNLDGDDRHVGICPSKPQRPAPPQAPVISYQNGTDFGLRAVHTHCERYTSWVRSASPTESISVATTETTSTVVSKPMLLDRFRNNVRTLLREFSDDEDELENKFENEDEIEKGDDEYLHYIDFREYVGRNQNCEEDDDDRRTVICCTDSAEKGYDKSEIHSTPIVPANSMTVVTMTSKHGPPSSQLPPSNSDKNGINPGVEHDHHMRLRRLLLSHVFRTEMHVRLFWPPSFSLSLNEHHHYRGDEPLPAYVMGTSGLNCDRQRDLLHQDYEQIFTKQLDAAAADMRRRYRAMDAYLDGACAYYNRIDQEDSLKNVGNN